MTVSITLPSNTPVLVSQERAKEIEDHIRKTLPSLKYIVSTVGASGRNQGTHKATIEAYFKDDPDRPSTMEMADTIRPFVNAMPGVDGSVSGFRQNMGGGKPIQLVVKGEDLETLYRIAEQIRDRIRHVPE